MRSVRFGSKSAKIRCCYCSCRFCSLKLEKSRLRHHIAKHIMILKDIQHTSTTCGFCGNNGCPISLVKTSGKGINANYGPKIDKYIFYLALLKLHFLIN